ncbi:MAG: thiamine phosphate synthase [Myxococcota bacterium]
MKVSWRGFYAIVDPAVCEPVVTAEAILRGGCAVLQLRDKRGDDRQTVAIGRELASRCREAGVPFVMNDRLDLALIAGADGLHLGQDDLTLADARPHFAGPIGVSTHSLVQAESAIREGADLIGLGPIFPTTSKENPDPVVGLEGLRDVCARVEVPVVAIGGLSPDHAADLSSAGAPLAAAISAVCRASDPAEPARRFHEALR